MYVGYGVGGGLGASEGTALRLGVSDGGVLGVLLGVSDGAVLGSRGIQPQASLLSSFLVTSWKVAHAAEVRLPLSPMSSKAPHVKQTLLNVISVAGCVTSIPAPHMEHGSNRAPDGGTVSHRQGRCSIPKGWSCKVSH